MFWSFEQRQAFEATRTGGITATSDRFRQSVVCRNLLLFDGFDVQSQTQVAMRRSLRSAGTVPVVTMRQSTISHLRASATIIVFRVEPRPFLYDMAGQLPRVSAAQGCHAFTRLPHGISKTYPITECGHPRPRRSAMLRDLSVLRMRLP
jgi:hypothetical protein